MKNNNSNKNNTENLLTVGRFGRTHGVKGWIIVNSFTQPAENITQYQQWHIEQKGQWHPINVDAIKSAKNILVKIEGIDSPEAAKHLTQSYIAIDKNELAQLDNDDYYWHQLIGCQVQQQDGKEIGTVKELMETGANDVLVVQHNNKEHLVPYIEQVIIDVDLANERIIVDWDIDY